MSLFRKGSVVVSGTGIGALLAYVFNPFFIGPRLGPEGIALIGTFLSLSCIFSFLYLPLSTVVVRFVSEFFAHNRTAESGAFILYLRKKVGLFGILAILLLLLATKPIMHYLRLTSIWPVVFALILAYIYLIEKILIASFQGLQRFHHQAMSLILDPSVRLILGVSLVLWGFNAMGVMAAYVAGHLAVLLFSSFLLRDVFQAAKGTKAVLPVDGWRFSLPATVYAFFITFSVSIDNLLAKHFFTSHSAGTFIAAMTLARTSSILIYPICSVAFSLMSHAHSQKKQTRIFFLQATGLLTLSFLAMGVAFFVLPEWIITLTYGKAFNHAVPLLIFAGLAFAPIGYSILLANFNLARKHYSFTYGLALGACVHMALLMNFHSSLAEFMKANIVGSSSFLFFSFLGTLYDLKRKKTHPSDNLTGK